MFNKFDSTSIKTGNIKRIQFGVLGPDEIRSFSVVEVKTATAYDNDIPKENGLLDLRMGTTDAGSLCQSCHGNRTECPGHFGHIELARPMFHIGFLSTVLKVLRCVCFKCSLLLIDKSSVKFSLVSQIKGAKARFSEMVTLCNGIKRCGGGSENNIGCNYEQPKYTKENIHVNVQYPESYRFDKNFEKKCELSAREIYDVFVKISDEDCRLLGFSSEFSRPDWLLLTVLPIPPPAVRPTVRMDSISYSLDDLTHKLADIVKFNNELKSAEEKGLPEHVVSEIVELLQYHVATLIDNEIPGLPQAQQRGGKPIKSLRQRLVGKAGRVRGNLMGKRVDFSARTVISGDPRISIEELGIPRSIAMNLTIPERVTKFNINDMRELVKRGPVDYPGAKAIIRNDNRIIDLRYVKRYNDENIQLGYVVERHLKDGDIVLFNRQPTLHKMSFMAHRVKILPFSTFRLNLSVTTPYNADFDGDEMNLHVPQSLESRAEAQELMTVSRNIVSPQGNRPIIGIVQDSLLGAMKFTKRDCFLSKVLTYNLLMWLDSWDGTVPAPAIVKPTPLWTGKQLFSVIIPEVNYAKYSSNYKDGEPETCPSDTRVLIHKGELLMGIVDKRTLGRSFGSLIHVLWNEYGPEVCKTFIDELQLIITYWMLQEGASVGIEDTIADSNTLYDIDTTIVNAKKEVTGIINRARSGDLNRFPGQSIMETFETNVNNALNSATESAGKAVQRALLDKNNIKQMVDAGSKGNLINICQIIACVGQQNVQGRRIPYGFRDRTLPHFKKDDLGPESRGFVANSYLQGLTPQEMFFHAMGGREGLVDTAVKTAETGYIQRRLVKAMEHLMIRYDGTVRNSLDEVVQFLYGEDGIDGTYIEQQTIESVWKDKTEFVQNYVWSDEDLDNAVQPDIVMKLRQNAEDDELLEAEIAQLREDRIYYRKNITNLNDFSQKVYLPVNIERLVSNSQKIFSISQFTKSDLSPVDVIKQVKLLCEKFVVVRKDDYLHREAKENATILFKIQVRSCLSSKVLIARRRLTSQAFSWLLEEIDNRFLASLADPGEMIGTLAAQSIGEPATQMTLNTFHYAGVSAKNVTLGVPRLRELINVTSQIRTPGLTIYLKPEIAQDSSKATSLLNKLEYTTLRGITAYTEIYYDPDDSRTVVKEDEEFLQTYSDLPLFGEEDATDPESLSNWVLRIVLDKKSKQTKGISNKEIADKINTEFEGDLNCVFNSDNADSPVLRIRMINQAEAEPEFDPLNGEELSNQDDVFLLKVENNLLTKMALRGVPGITKVFMQKVSKKGFDSETEKFVDDKQEWVLDTEGVNLREVITMPEVDYTRTISNDILEMYEVFGIEAARMALLNEIRNVISFDGSYVNIRHISILVDTMTHRGHLMSITRSGINRMDTGPLMRCSFEETAEVLQDAAMFAERDDLAGVSENIMFGKLAKIGTGSFDLLLNEKKLAQAVSTQDDNELEYDLYGAGELSPSLVTPAYKMGTPSSPGRFGNGLYSPLMGEFSPAGVGSALSPLTGADGYSSSKSKFTPSSPSYSPTSPSYSPASPSYSPTSPNYSPTSPSYSPTSPNYSPTSPSYSPTSPNYSPTSPSYSPTSPNYSPTSPNYSPTSPNYSPTSPSYSPTSPNYTSPVYSKNNPQKSSSSSGNSSVDDSSLLDGKEGSFSPEYSMSPTYSPSSPSYVPYGQDNSHGKKNKGKVSPSSSSSQSEDSSSLEKSSQSDFSDDADLIKKL